MKNKRILSGIQPSGQVHIGNYFGMMKQMIDLQNDNKLLCFIPNYHALTSQNFGENLSYNTLDIAANFLSLGLNPDKSIFWVQSDIPEVAELNWILSNFVSVSSLERSTSYKDKISKGLKPNHGLFSYPILMAADILLFGAEVVPVGKDQKQHLEITRDIVSKFNSVFGDLLIKPKPLITELTGLVLGTDGQKMSKSYNNFIEIFCDKDELSKKIMRIKTDNSQLDQPKKTVGNPLFEIYCLFLNEKEKIDLEKRFKTPGLRYSDIKNELIETFWSYFSLARERKKNIFSDKDLIIKILKDGSKKAKELSSPIINRIRKKTGLNYLN